MILLLFSLIGDVGVGKPYEKANIYRFDRFVRGYGEPTHRGRPSNLEM